MPLDAHGPDLSQGYDAQVRAVAAAIFPRGVCAAKSLAVLSGIRQMLGKKSHNVDTLCDRHEVVIANGCQSESLLLGKMFVKGMNMAEREVLVDIFGHPKTASAALKGPLAGQCLTADAARNQLAKYSF